MKEFSANRSDRFWLSISLLFKPFLVFFSPGQISRRMKLTTHPL
jgi:hypothetical protein